MSVEFVWFREGDAECVPAPPASLSREGGPHPSSLSSGVKLTHGPSTGL